MRIGILGGSFNPVHKDHVKIASTIIDKLALDKMLILPNATPPHKNSCHLDFKTRLKLLKLSGFSKLEHIEFSTLEQDESVCHYSIDTLKILKQTYKDDKLYFCMGQDSLNYLDKWHQGLNLIDYANLVVVGRCGYDLSKANPQVLEFLKTYRLDEHSPDFLNKFNSNCNYCITLDCTFNLISSSMLRDAFLKYFDNNDQSALALIEDNLDKEVFNYILENHIYKK